MSQIKASVSQGAEWFSLSPLQLVLEEAKQAGEYLEGFQHIYWVTIGLNP